MSEKMASTSFPQFTRLPAELQRRVWELATHDPDKPGVHFFTWFRTYWSIWKFRCRFDIDPLAWFSCTRQFAGTDYWGPNILTVLAPSASHIDWDDVFDPAPGRLSWTERNRSSYLVDYGLWNACRESRYVMERTFGKRPSLPWPEMDDWIPFPPAATRYEPDMPIYLSYTPDGDTTAHYHLYPANDLIILQVAGVKTSFLRAITSQFVSQRHVWNIAIEYDHRWMASASGDVASAVLRNFERVRSGFWANLYFYDRRLVPKPSRKQICLASSKRVFYDKDDAAFFRVEHQRDVTLRAGTGAPGVLSEEDGVSSIFEFVRDMNAKARMYNQETTHFLGPHWPIIEGIIACAS